MTNVTKHHPIKVCFISPKAYPIFNPKIDGVFGGAEVDLYLLSRELAKDKNFQTSVIVADYHQEPQEIIDHVYLIRSVDFKKNPMINLIRLWKAMKRIEADIYFMESATLGCVIICLFCLWHKKKYMYRTANDGECDGSYIKEKGIAGKLFRWTMQKTSVLVTQNEENAEQLERTVGVSPVVIRNGGEIPELSMLPREYVLWVGRSAHVKRPDLYLDLAQQFPKESFVAICPQGTYDHTYKQLQQRARSLGNLKFLTGVPFEKIDDYFSKAKVLVNTSDSEGFPNVFLQAAKCATPILSLNVNPDQILTQYKFGLFAQGDMELMKQQLESLLNPAVVEDMGRNGYHYAKEHHDIKKITEQYKTIFNKEFGH